MPNLQARQKLSPPDLIALLNWELAAYEECDGCHVTGVETVPGSWKAKMVDDTRAPSLAKEMIVAHVLAETREQFYVA